MYSILFTYRRYPKSSNTIIECFFVKVKNITTQSYECRGIFLTISQLT